MKGYILYLKIITIYFLRFIGFLIKIFTLFEEKNYILYYSKDVKKPNDNHLYFKSLIDDFYKDKSYKTLYINNPKSIKEKISISFKLIKSKLFIYNIPSDLLIFRLLFANGSKKILIPTGIAIKSGGIFAKNLSHKEKKFYIMLCRDLDYFFVSSLLEKYITISSLDINYRKIKILKRVNEYNDRKLAISEINSLRKKYNFIISYFPTHRDHLQNNCPTLFQLITQKTIKILKENNILLLYNLHPLDNSDFLIINKDFIKSMNDVITNPNDAIDLFDSMITDYSGIYLKILLEFQISLAFVLTDFNTYSKERGVILPKEILFTGEHIYTENDLIIYLKNIKKYSPDDFITSRRNLFYLLGAYDNKDNLKSMLQ